MEMQLLAIAADWSAIATSQNPEHQSLGNDEKDNDTQSRLKPDAQLIRRTEDSNSQT